MERTQQKVRTTRPQLSLAERILNPTIARPWMVGALAVSDALSLFLAGFTALFLWSFVRSDLIIQNYTSVIPLIIIFTLVYSIAGLYPAVGMGPVEELRLLTILTTLSFLGMGTLSFYLRNVEQFSRASFGLAWLFALILLPLNRHLFRKLFTALGFWGEPVVLIGYGQYGEQILNVLLKNPELGMRPVAIIDGFDLSVIPDVPIPIYSLGGNVNPDRISSLSGVKTAILIHSEIPTELCEKIVSGQWYEFSRLIMIPDGQFGSSVWVETHDIGGMLGLEVKQKLFSRYEQAIKRSLDIFLIVLASPFLIILFGLIAIIIRLESPGSILYKQVRLGKGGRTFLIWKFRTMVKNADEVLEQYLEMHPELADEWEETHKLRDDPRVTGVGKILRRFSLDEYPQFWNVLKGEMSLVGPRPIVDDEIKYYGSACYVCARVKPGLSGLWQVSGRNDIKYEQRVKLDLYYVHNWSIWLDVYILAKTVKVVINGKGAY